MTRSQSRQNSQDLPSEFFLPPDTKQALWRETGALLLGSAAFIGVLAVIVTLTQGLVIEL